MHGVNQVEYVLPKITKKKPKTVVDVLAQHLLSSSFPRAILLCKCQCIFSSAVYFEWIRMKYPWIHIARGRGENGEYIKRK